MERLEKMMEEVVSSNKLLVKQVAALSAKVDKIDLLSAKIDLMEKKIDSLDTTTEKAGADLHDQGIELDHHDKRIKALESKLEDAMNEIDRLEHHSRKNNLLLLFSPEKSEKDNMISYLATLLSDKLQIQIQESDIQAAHRVGEARQTGKPRRIIFKMYQFQKKLDILKAATSTEIKVDGQLLKIKPDKTTRMRQREQEYWPLREPLHENGIKTKLRNPGWLQVWIESEIFTYKSPQEAKAALQTAFPEMDFGS